MRNTLLAALLALVAAPATAQITITGNDMPVPGDTLRYSMADPGQSVDFTTTGTSQIWNFSSLIPVAQAVDTYRIASQVDPAYASSSFSSAYGCKIADSLKGSPIPVKSIYTFYNKVPSSSPVKFVAQGFGGNALGQVIPVPYSDEDEVYMFPLTYPHTPDSTTFALTYSAAAYLSQKGYRKTSVDGYGTITTPYTTSPVNVIRVRSEVVETDSFSVLGSGQRIDRHYVEYKWLSNTEHRPLLTITTDKAGSTESVSSIQYRDAKRAGVGVINVKPSFTVLTAYPNPAQGAVTLQLPASWTGYSVRVYDAAGRQVLRQQGVARINTEALPSGVYTVMVDCAGAHGLAQFTK